MYLTHDNKEQYWVLDLESNGLKDATKIWLVVVQNLQTEEVLEFFDSESFNLWHNSDHIYIGHNLLSFDLPLINRLWKTELDVLRCVDTLVLSLLFNPALENGHSLDAWGQRLKFPKGNHTDWSQYSEEMRSYCLNDIRLTFKLFQALTNRMSKMGYSEQSCWIEHHIRDIINTQEINGFWLDKVRATDLLQQLKQSQSDLTRDIQKLFPPVSKLIKSGSYKRNKDGSLPAFLEKARDRYDRVVIKGSQYEYYQNEEFNIGSPKQRVERLLELGWKPEKFTSKGFPKVDEDALMAFSETINSSEIRAMSEWLVLQGRSSMVEGWLNNLGEDSRIHGRVNTCGASTRRMVHSLPNSANIPSPHKAKYGKECRELWGVEPGKGLIEVGVDASGLENVCLLHYLNNPKATKLLTQPKPDDVHTMNSRLMSQALGFECDREWAAKTSFFSLVFGAGDNKLGSIVKKGPREGAIIREVIVQNVPGLERVIKESQDEFRKNNGRLRCIDGGMVLCPSFNASLNYRVQSAGACVMKMACIILKEEAEKQDLWFNYLGNIHDEFQMQTKEEDGERLGRLAVWSIEEAARRLHFNVPLTGEFRLGYNWASCH